MTLPRLLLPLLALLSPASLLVAQTPGSISISTAATTTILAPLTLKQGGSLSFGSVAVLDAGTVAVAPDGSTTVSSSLALSAGSSNAPSPLIIQLSSTPRVPFSFAVSPNSGSSIVMTGPGGAQITVDTPIVTFDGVAATLDTGRNVYPGTTGATGGTEIRMGATMHVSAGQTAGAYSGTYNVTLAYQ